MATESDPDSDFSPSPTTAKAIAAALVIAITASIGLAAHLFDQADSRTGRLIHLAHPLAHPSFHALAQVERLGPDTITFQFLQSKNESGARALRPDAHAEFHGVGSRAILNVSRALTARTEPVDADLAQVTLELTRDGQTESLQVGTWVELQVDGPTEKEPGYVVPVRAIVWINGQPGVQTEREPAVERTLASSGTPAAGTEDSAAVPTSRRIPVRLIATEGDAYRVYSSELNDETLVVADPTP